MFDQLVESRPQRSRSSSQMFFSIAAHTVIIAISIQLTRAVAETVVKRPVTVDMRLSREAPRAAPHAAPAATSPAISRVPIALPPVTPMVVPTTIPPIDPGNRFDPHRLDPRGSTDDLMPGPPNEAPVNPQLLVTLRQADEPATYLDGPGPVYPPALRQVGIEGWVALQYIVGIDGRAEPASITIVRSTNASFEAAAVEAIRLAHFRAARIRGQSVRQVVEQVVRFTLGTRG